MGNKVRFTIKRWHEVDNIAGWDVIGLVREDGEVRYKIRMDDKMTEEQKEKGYDTFLERAKQYIEIDNGYLETDA